MLVGDEIDLVQNTANLQYSRPFDRGYLNTWDSEIQVWRRLFGEQKLKVRVCVESTHHILGEALDGILQMLIVLFLHYTHTPD